MIKARFFESQEAYDEYSESRGGYMHEQVTAIIRANGTICADLITDCKRWQTAVKRFFDAVAGDSRFAGWRETITESINGGVWEDRESVDGGYVYGGYAWGVEEVAPGTYYIFLNVPAPQQPAQPEAEQEADAPEWVEREPYDYRAAIIADIKAAINSGEYDLTEYDSREEAEEALNDKMWIDDSITGNASGSYTFSRYRAEEYLCHNAALLFEALDEFGGEIPREAEAADVTIRCYLLGECIAAALDDIGYSWDD